jgi:hypothetical protein
MTEFKTKIKDQEVTLKLLEPTVLIQEKCDREYHVAYAQLLRLGVLPRSAMEKIMREHGVWTREHDDELREMQLEILAMEASLDEGGIESASKMANLRREMFELVQIKTSVLEHCCESVAEKVKQQAYLAYAVVDQNGKPVFDNLIDFIKRQNEPVAIDAMDTYNKKLQEMFENAVNALPEAVFLQKFQKDGEASKPKAKKGRKKKVVS